MLFACGRVPKCDQCSCDTATKQLHPRRFGCIKSGQGPSVSVGFCGFGSCHGIFVWVSFLAGIFRGKEAVKLTLSDITRCVSCVSGIDATVDSHYRSPLFGRNTEHRALPSSACRAVVFCASPCPENALVGPFRYTQRRYVAI